MCVGVVGVAVSLDDGVSAWNVRFRMYVYVPAIFTDSLAIHPSIHPLIDYITPFSVFVGLILVVI